MCVSPHSFIGAVTGVVIVLLSSKLVNKLSLSETMSQSSAVGARAALTSRGGYRVYVPPIVLWKGRDTKPSVSNK